MVEYISHKDTNKAVRAALKAAFPGHKFSVTGSDHSATNVSWTDGPLRAEVEEVVDRFCCGKGLDPSGDYTVTGHSVTPFDLTVDTREKDEKGKAITKVVPAGTEVSWGPTYLFASQEISKELREEALAKTAELMGVDPAALDYRTEYDGGQAHPVAQFTGRDYVTSYGTAWGGNLVDFVARRLAAARFHGEPEDYQATDAAAAEREARQLAAEKWSREYDARMAAAE